MDGTGGEQKFTAILDGSGTLLFKGESDTLGSNADGWINGHLPIPLMDGLEITVSMSVPIDDTGSTAARDIEMHFYLRAEQKAVNDPQPNMDNGLLVQINVDEGGLLYYIYSRTGGDSYIELFSGSTYDDASARATGDIEATIWRIVVHDGHPDEASPADKRHIHVYLKQLDTIANAETAEENELSSSPYDISYFWFDIAYPAYEIRTQNGSYFDDGQEAKSDYLEINYDDCDFDTKWDITPANRLLGGVEIYDGDPSASGVKVYDVDHVFSGDAYIRNGLLELHIDELIQYGMKLSYWTGAAYAQPLQQTPYLYNTPDLVACLYPELLKVINWGPEKVCVLVRMHDTATADSDSFFDIRISVYRGKYCVLIEVINMMQRGNFYFAIFDATAGAFRFSYGQDDYIADDDVNPAPAHNTTMSDNYMCSFDEAQEAIIAVLATNEKPGSFSPDDGSINMRNFAAGAVGSVAFILGYVPFALIANVFKEAEDATGVNTTTEADAGASGGEVERMNAVGNYLTPAGDYIYYRVVAGTELPEGRYRAEWRAKDNNQVADDFRTYVYNQTDSEFRNEENEKVTHTLTASFALMNEFYSVVFDITAADVSGTNNIDIVCEKATGDANNIDTDYVALVYLGDGESGPQDISHNMLRKINNERRLYDR